MTAIPYKYSTHVIAVIINSSISRYYAFTLLRSALLLRRKAHRYPRNEVHNREGLKSNHRNQ